MPFTRPGFLKDADLLAKNARRQLHRQRDLLTVTQFNECSAKIDELDQAVRDGQPGDRERIDGMMTDLDKSFAKIHPMRADASIRENCEVILVALVLAIAIRAYFLQPFKIPTGSMEPTLNGIVVHRVPAKEAFPNVVRQLGEYVWLGRTYADAVSAVEDEIVAVQPVKKFLLLNYTRVTCASGHVYDVYLPPEQNQWRDTELYTGRALEKGEPIVHAYVDTGDQVFVDKFTYNFRRPQGEDVFVFNTLGIRGTRRDGMDPNIHSEYYIKRLAGTPGDELRIDSPHLFINGAPAVGKYFERVESAQDGYRGYSNPSHMNFHFLLTPEDTFKVPPDKYFALGDNSYNSSDSRDWGTVPARNVVGRGLFVYYPFTWHWGLIH